jgi:hypothetical protein
LQLLPDISLPLDENDAVADNTSSRQQIVDEAPESINLPLGYTLSRPSRGDPYYCVVRIDEVVAGSLKVPTVKNGNKSVTLREFGSTPFHIILPGTMLRLKRGNRRELADATTYESMPVQTRASSYMNGSGSDLPSVKEVFGTERQQELLSTAEDEVIDPEQ